jgi:hypothetical protein
MVFNRCCVKYLLSCTVIQMRSKDSEDAISGFKTTAVDQSSAMWIPCHMELYKNVMVVTENITSGLRNTNDPSWGHCEYHLTWQACDWNHNICFWSIWSALCIPSNKTKWSLKIQPCYWSICSVLWIPSHMTRRWLKIQPLLLIHL